jgi:hypothetical protein
MDRADYEWHYYIGGDCKFKHRKLNKPIGYIYHRRQGEYEAVLVRNVSWDGLTEDVFPLGIFTDSNQAQDVVNKALQPLWEKA